jgi:hypothetical protein
MHSRDAGFARSNRECRSKIILSGEGSLFAALGRTADTITARGIIRARGTGYYSPMWANNQTRSGARFSVASDWAVCSNTIGQPHEYFYQTGTRLMAHRSVDLVGTPRGTSVTCGDRWKTAPRG